MSSRIEIEGNTTSGIDYHVSPKGVATARFTIMVNDRFRDKDGNWTTGPGEAYNVVAFYGTAENLANSDLTTKDTLFVIGDLEVHGWVDNEGNKRKDRRVVAAKVLYNFARHTINATRTERATETTEDPWVGEAPLDEPPF